MNLLMIAASVICSGGAQIMIKFSSRFETMSLSWIAAMGGSVALYGVSFVLYSLILKEGALSRISPIMTIATAILVILSGILLFGEQISLRQGIGFALGVGAIILILS